MPRLIWDTYFYGCFLASTIVQVFVSVNAPIASIYWITYVHAHYYDSRLGLNEFLILCSVLVALSSVAFILILTQAWAHGPEGAWKLGIKDLAQYPASQETPLQNAKAVIFGKLRKLANIRMLPMSILMCFKTVLIRRIP